MKDWLTMTGHRAAVKGSAAMIAALALLALLSPEMAQAASFDCAKAETAVEKMICADAELSKADEELAETFTAFLASMANPEAGKTAQRSWLRNVRDTCKHAACLKAAYRRRISDLLEAAGAPPSARVKMAVDIAEGFVTLDEVGNPFDENGLPIGPGDLLPVGYSYEGVRIDYIRAPQDSSLCQGIALGFRQRSMTPIDFCGVPFPKYSGNNYGDFSRVPPWRRLDAADNLDLVKEFYFWANMRIGVFDDGDIVRQKASVTIIPELFESLWTTSEDRVNALIAAGRIALQVSQFDYDNDGVNEAVYRMSALRVSKRGEPPVFQGRACRTVVPGWSDAPMSYIVEKGGRLLWRGTGQSLFRYGGTTYRIASGSAAVDQTGAGLGVSSICRFTPKRRTTP